MENLDKILPLIVILITFIFSIYRNVRKEKEEKQRKAASKKQTTPSNKQTVSRPVKIEPVQRPVKAEPVPQPVKTQPVSREYRPATEYTFFSSGKYEGYNPEEVEPVTSAFTVTDNLSDKKQYAEVSPELGESVETSAVPSFNLQDRDEITRAVIYAEILDRKYK